MSPGKKLIDSTIILAGGVEMVMGALMAAFPNYIPPWLAWLCLGVGAVTIGYGLYRLRQEFWEWLLERARADVRSSSERTPWQTELYDHRLNRHEFWRLLEVAYGNWSMKPTPARSLRDVVRGAKVPSDLPLADNTKFPKWAWEAETHCPDDDAKQLLQLASTLYIAARPPATVKSQLMGTTQEFDRFDQTVRMELSKFWDHWGRQEPLEQVIREQKADPIVKAHASEIKMLTFLEIARVRWAGADLPGKSGLFRLGRRNAETGDQSSDSRTD
jgi:hypothetical protein